MSKKSVKSFDLVSGRSPADSAADLPVSDAVVQLPNPWMLHHGDELASAHLAYRVVGPEAAPVVAVLGGISAHRASSCAGRDGWWQEMVGPGARRRYRQFRVLGIDYLGGSGESSAPQTGRQVPAAELLRPGRGAAPRSFGIWV